MFITHEYHFLFAKDKRKFSKGKLFFTPSGPEIHGYFHFSLISFKVLMKKKRFTGLNKPRIFGIIYYTNTIGIIGTRGDCHD